MPGTATLAAKDSKSNRQLIDFHRSRFVAGVCRLEDWRRNQGITRRSIPATKHVRMTGEHGAGSAATPPSDPYCLSSILPSITFARDHNRSERAGLLAQSRL